MIFQYDSIQNVYDLKCTKCNNLLLNNINHYTMRFMWFKYKTETV